MNVGIIAATNIEMEFLKKKLNFKEISNIARWSFVSGDYNNICITYVVCGIGKVNAALATQILINEFKVSHIIMIGIAGAIHPELKIGDVIISDKVMYHDFDNTLLSKHPLHNSDEYFEADKTLINYFRNTLLDNDNSPNTFVGTMIAGDHFITSKGHIDELILSFEPYCVDMESVSVAHTCYSYSTPFVIIKAISDLADQSLEELKMKNVVKATMCVTTLVMQMLNNARAE